MTHGEDPSPETHKDSAVLTYLEGLLMHPVEVGPGGTASGRSEDIHCNQEQADKVRVVFQHHSHGLTPPKAGTNGQGLGSSQHLKKARLLQSGAWNEPFSQPMNPPAVDLKGQRQDLQNGSLDVSHNAGESTLLASLLQSFSSRLQSVAMSQQPNPPSSECSSPSKELATEKDSLQIYKSAAGHLMKKSKHNNRSSTPYSHRGHSQDGAPASPQSVHRSTPPSASSAAESVSCAERLKAVANMVKIRSSPTASPKPSVACSQLALLLSSEAHFQQYSKVHALKVQFSGRCASERLAAIANQQHGRDKRPPSAGRTLSPLTTQTGLTETPTTTVTPKVLRGSSSPPPMCGHSQSSPSYLPLGPNHSPSNPSREKRGMDSRPSRPPQTCSSLLLLLLNNHNSQNHLTKNGHLEDSYGLFPQSCSSSVTSDSECSHRERSLAKDSSDGESSHSSCSPMDLSVRSRASTQDAGLKASPLTATLPVSSSATAASSAPLPICSSAIIKTPTIFSPCSHSFSSVSTVMSSSALMTSSLDKLTESLINKWKPEPSASKCLKENEPDVRTDLKSPPKVTLMQLLLERRHTDGLQKGLDGQDLRFSISQGTNIQGQKNGLKALKENIIKSPLDKAEAPAQALYSFSHYPSSGLAMFPYLSPHIQSSPLDLCKSKSTSPEMAFQPAFSASKMLQNLAQSSSSSSPPILSSKGVAQELDARTPLNPRASPTATVGSTSSTPLSDRPSSCGTPKEDFLPSQIENLLEKRTVLQLLLGTAAGSSAVSQKSQFSTSGRALDIPGGCYEKGEGTSVVYNSANEAPLAMNFKTEITQESEYLSVIYQDSAGREESSASEKTDSVADFCPNVKKECQVADNASKYGLLSQLLKQQSPGYYSSTAESRARPVPGERFHQARLVPEEHLHVPSPKKRRLCYSQADVFNHLSPSQAADSENKTHFYCSLQEELKKQKNVKEEETSVHKAASESFTRESQGFNVLKQLLLSDNCLKELSQQSQETASPCVLQAASKVPEASFSQPTCEQSLPHLRSCHPHASLNSGFQSHLALPKPSPGDAVRLHQKQGLNALVKQELRSTDSWTSQETEEKDKGESTLDSPQLSRSNPILYYMLQKGSIHLRKKLREPKGTPERSIKEESASEFHNCEHSLTSPAHTQTLHLQHSRQSRGLS